jgi:hypothetical protein
MLLPRSNTWEAKFLKVKSHSELKSNGKMETYIWGNLNLNNGPLSYNIAKSAGTSCKVLKKELKGFYSLIKLPSGNLRKVSLASLGFLGKTSNEFISEFDHIINGTQGYFLWGILFNNQRRHSKFYQIRKLFG